MRFLLSGAIAALTMFAAAAPAAAESIECPVREVRRAISTPIPSGWFQTPVVSRLTETRVRTVGGIATMQCVYSEAGIIQREVAREQTCTARTGGFECAGAGAPPPTPVSEAHSTGAFNVRSSYSFDLDAGREGTTSAEFWYESITARENYLVPRNGARYAIMTATEPDYTACTGATFINTRARIESVGSRWLCVRTSEGRVGKFRMSGASTRTMAITYTTWR